MLGNFGHAIHNNITKKNNIGGVVGSDWDMWWQNAHHRNYGPCDPDSSIIQDFDEPFIQFRIFEMDGSLFHVDTGRSVKIHTPFWEPPSPDCNPDSPNNPQLPLVFFPISTLYITIIGQCALDIASDDLSKICG